MYVLMLAQYVLKVFILVVRLFRHKYLPLLQIKQKIPQSVYYFSKESLKYTFISYTAL